jgi:SAM-dependent methyltransferase
MSKLTVKHDAYGAAMWDYFRGKGGYEIVERDDGFFGPSSGPPAYLAPYAKWPAHQRRAIRLARERVLDVGCGCGRVALHLQEKGLAVTAIDISPLAIKVCKARGVKDVRVMSITQISGKLRTFETVIMYGNNFGLFADPEQAKQLLRRLHGMTGPRGRIIAESNDIYPRKGRPCPRCHREYHEFNRARGRLPGQLRLRIRYRKHVTPWFDYLLVSKDEMRQIVAGTGWRISRFFDSDGPMYIAVLEKECADKRCSMTGGAT